MVGTAAGATSGSPGSCGRRGTTCYTPTLTGLGERSHLLSPDVDLDLHIDDVVAVLHYEDLRDVILVGHSYGGMVITGVADRAADRVGRLVYLDAANPVNGQSLVDIAGPVLEVARAVGREVGRRRARPVPAPDAGLFYGVTDPDDLAWMAERLTPHPWSASSSRCGSPTRRRCGRSRSTTSCARRRWPTRDPELIGKARAAGRLWEIDTGHDLMITEPRAVADALLEIASS